MSELITIDIYKQAKALTSSKDDERLTAIVEGVNQLVKTYCGTTFTDYVTVDKVEYHNLSSSIDAIQLKETPIISITSVEERASTTDSYTTLTVDEDYILDSDTDMLYRVDSKWPSGIHSVKVTYKAGYATVPVDLQLALIDLVHYYKKEEYVQDRSLGGATIQSQFTSSIGDNTGFPDHIRRVLDLYRVI